MLETILLDTLKPNDWNPNKVDPINQEKLEKSLQIYGQQIPIIVRSLEDGTNEIVDGEHRVMGARNLGWFNIQAIQLGVCSVEEAKRKTLIANSRYGKDDNSALFDLLSTDGVFKTAEDILETMPIDESELAGLFSSDDIDLSMLDDTDDEGGSGEIELELPDSRQSTRILRFKVDSDDADDIEEQIETVKAQMGLNESDAITNAGDALVILLKGK
jgi:hypothetical protein